MRTEPSARRGPASALARLLHTRAPATTLLLRLAVGFVFVSEGAQKFLFPAELGAGRFTRIGLPAPQLLAPFVGVTELCAGALVLLGLGTRAAALALAVDMLVALASTKLPLLLRRGFWHAAHESRTDLAMLATALFLLVVGAGRGSLDARLAGRAAEPDA